MLYKEWKKYLIFVLSWHYSIFQWHAILLRFVEWGPNAILHLIWGSNLAFDTSKPVNRCLFFKLTFFNQKKLYIRKWNIHHKDFFLQMKKTTHIFYKLLHIKQLCLNVKWVTKYFDTKKPSLHALATPSLTVYGFPHRFTFILSLVWDDDLLNRKWTLCTRAYNVLLTNHYQLLTIDLVKVKVI